MSFWKRKSYVLEYGILLLISALEVRKERGMRQVFFFSYKEEENALTGLKRLFDRSAFEGMIPRGEPVAIKLHMGELGNIRHIRPVFVRKVVDIIRGKEGKPFLFDTVANYPGSRATKARYLDTAARNGFVEASVNAPVVIADDADELQTIPITNPIDGCEMKEIKVSSLLLKPSLLVVLSHVKGHELTGFGGALKNLGMGCVSTQTKRAQHCVNMPIFAEERECNGCGKCADACPHKGNNVRKRKAPESVSRMHILRHLLFQVPLALLDLASRVEGEAPGLSGPCSQRCTLGIQR